MSSSSNPFGGTVLVVGAGLLGTSIGLALRRRGVDVSLADLSPENVRIATGLGAANVGPDSDEPVLVVVAVPPDAVADVVTEALRDTAAVVTDVAPGARYRYRTSASVPLDVTGVRSAKPLVSDTLKVVPVRVKRRR